MDNEACTLEAINRIIVSPPASVMVPILLIEAATGAVRQFEEAKAFNASWMKADRLRKRMQRESDSDGD